MAIYRARVARRPYPARAPRSFAHRRASTCSPGSHSVVAMYAHDETAPASDADRVRLVDAGGAGLRGRFAASSVSSGLDMVGFLSRRHRGCSCRHGDILRSERAFNIRRQGQNGRIPCRSRWLQLALLPRWVVGLQADASYLIETATHLHASLDEIFPRIAHVSPRVLRESDRPSRLSRRSAGPNARLGKGGGAWTNSDISITPNNSSFGPPNFPQAPDTGPRDQWARQCVGLDLCAPASSAL